MFWMGAYTLRGEVGGGWALEFPSFLELEGENERGGGGEKEGWRGRIRGVMQGC